MRAVKLAKTGLNKLKSNQFELKQSDLEGSIKSFTIGEWVEFHGAANERWIGFVNPLIDEKYISSYVLSTLNNFKGEEEFIGDKLNKAYSRREVFLGYERNSRMFYGNQDGLPGLIIDQYENASIIQINVAGLDKYRDFIKSHVEGLTKKSAFFLDNQKYREKELLPVFEKNEIPDIQVIENDLKYKISSEVLQKVGFYFDHRENRSFLKELLPRLNINKRKALDLFSYVGAWGICALQGGVESVEFVDQGNFESDVNEALKLNSFKERGEFIRGDVFKFLETKTREKVSYDIILCDPPAFAKSPSQKKDALEGYSKLHRRVLKLAGESALVVFSSCTQYVGHEEFQKNIQQAAYRENKTIQLIHSGIQGFDHPISSVMDRTSYIKSYFYIVE